MKKVGLLTCYLDNCGACLQAYALQRMVKQLGYDCDIVKYTPPTGYVKESFFSNLVHNRIYYLVRSMFNDRYKQGYYSKKRHMVFNEFRKKMSFTKKSYTDDNLKMMSKLPYDMFVCGSDQIWNPTIYNRNNKVYFLDFVPENKARIAYAPSIGLESIPVKYQADFISLVSNFDVVSVREKRGVEIIKELAGIDAEHVLDPTLLLCKEQWDMLNVAPLVKEPYVFIYLFGQNPYIKMFLEHFQTKTNLKIVCTPFTEREQKSNYVKLDTIGPMEFISLIKNAACVITDSFHATAFSINLNRPFYVLLRHKVSEWGGMNSRIYSLLGLTGLQNRLIENERDFPEYLELCINYDDVNMKLQNKRHSDIMFLKKALDNGSRKY